MKLYDYVPRLHMLIKSNAQTAHTHQQKCWVEGDRKRGVMGKKCCGFTVSRWPEH